MCYSRPKNCKSRWRAEASWDFTATPSHAGCELHTSCGRRFGEAPASYLLFIRGQFEINTDTSSRYWDVAANRPVLFEDIVKVREDYLRVLQEARRNHPDTWRGSSDIVKGVRRSRVKSVPESGK